MSWKTLVILAVVAAGLGGFLVVDNYWLVPKREKTEGAKGRLWTIEPKDVETVTIKRRGETIRRPPKRGIGGKPIGLRHGRRRRTLRVVAVEALTALAAQQARE